MKILTFQLFLILSYNLVGTQSSPGKIHSNEIKCPTVTLAGTFAEGDTMNKNFLTASPLIPVSNPSGPYVNYIIKSFKVLTTHANGQHKDFSVSGNQLFHFSRTDNAN
jgi:hypothetical protein